MSKTIFICICHTKKKKKKHMLKLNDVAENEDLKHAAAQTQWLGPG